MSTTAIYARVSIRHLKAAHDASHPGARLEPRKPLSRVATAPQPPQQGGSEVLAALDAEAEEEERGGVDRSPRLP